MGDWLERILENFEVVFWILIVFGSSLASWLRQRKKAQARAGQPAPRPGTPRQAADTRAERMGLPAAPASEPPPMPSWQPAESGPAPVPTLEELLEERGGDLFDEWELRDELESALPISPAPARAKASPLASLAPFGGAERQELGSVESRRLEVRSGEATFVDELEARFAGAGSLEAELDARRLGNLDQQDSAAEIARAAAWHPTASWREALILREIFGPPKAFESEHLPAFRI